jgi:hypothetical protein
MEFVVILIIIVFVIFVIDTLIKDSLNKTNTDTTKKIPFSNRTPEEAKDILDDAKENKEWMPNDEYNHYRNIAGKEHEDEFIQDIKEMDYVKAAEWIEMMKKHNYISDNVFRELDKKKEII